MTNPIPISTLAPHHPPPSSKAIHGLITLLWPYSSSNKEFAILLSDPDFRLRSKQGQVRVRFTGPSAEAVAKSRLGIGDEVTLSLEGARWEDDPEATRTPGRSVDGELLFARKVGLSVRREGVERRVEVDVPASPPRREEDVVAATPLPKNAGMLRESVAAGKGYVYTSPAFVKRMRLSEESFAYDPFAGDDMDVDDEGAERMTSFGRGVKWRYAAKTPSPTKETASVSERPEPESPTRQPQGPAAFTDGDEIAGKMLPPPRPKLQLPSGPPLSEATLAAEEQDGPSTPKLQPVESAMLPLPSPFPTETVSHYQFGSLDASSAIQDQADSTQFSDQTQPKDDEAMSEAPPIKETAQRDEQPQQRVFPTTSTPAIQPETPTQIPLTTGFGFGFDGAMASPAPRPKVSPQDEEKKRVMAQTFRSLFGFTGPSQSQPSVQPSEPVPKAQKESAPLVTELEKRRLDAGREVARSPEIEDFEEDDAQATDSPPSRDARAAGMDETAASEVQAPVPESEASQSPAMAAVDAVYASVPTSLLESEPTALPKADKDGEEAMIEATTPRLEPQSFGSPTIYDMDEAVASTPTAPFVDSQLPQSQQRQPEVIEIESSSEEEDEEEDDDDEQPTMTVQDVRRQAHEIPDTYQDSQAEDLMVVDEQNNHQAILDPFSQETPTTLQPQTTDESLFESFIDPDPEHLYPTLPSLEPTTHEPDDAEMKEPSPSPSHEINQLPITESCQPSRQTTTVEPPPQQQQPSYPSLPLSPSNSQSIQDMASQASLQIPETMTGLLPPTPQLTQVESSAEGLREMVGTTVESQEQIADVDAEMEDPAPSPAIEVEADTLASRKMAREVLREEERGEVEEAEPIEQSPVETQPLATEHSDLSAQPAAEAQQLPFEQIETGRVTRAKAKEPEKTEQRPVEAQQPPTKDIEPDVIEHASTQPQPPSTEPAETGRVTRAKAKEASPTKEHLVERPTQRTEQAQPDAAEQLPATAQPPSTAQVEAGRVTRAKAKKAAAGRVSIIPPAISSYFSPKRSSGVAPIQPQTTTDEPAAVAEPETNVHISPEEKAQTNGFSTSLSYFTPLSHLDSLLNPSSSQQTFTSSNTVDVFAVVTESTTDPVRAKAGPRDYYTIFRISDASLAPSTSVRVEVFRPYKNTLPSAEGGDVVLLRGFAVKSRKRLPYLLSGDASGWCVFSFSSKNEGGGKPKWALRAGEANGGGGLTETMAGPPVEFGEEEREHALSLKRWWDASRTDDDGHGVNGVNGHADSSPIAARL